MNEAPMFCPRCHRRFDDNAHRFCAYDGERLVTTPDIATIPHKPTADSGMILNNRYEVRGLIGRGGMARIYLAEDRFKREPVALKILDSLHLRTPGAVERFDREARIANVVTHPNIVKVLDTGQRPDGIPFMVLEYLFGETLGDWLRRNQTMAGHITLPVLSQMGAGLAAAHEAGIVHRDVKPDNLFLVGEPGEPYGVKILDFGLSRLEKSKTVSQMGMSLGTPEYMPPEQVVGDKTDARSDIYSLGVVMYRMCVGKLPFRADDDAQLLAQQLILAPPEPSEVVPGFDRATEGVILKAMRKRQEERYQTMDAFVEDIDRLMGKRLGSLYAGLLPRGADRYEPQSEMAKMACKFFYRKLGLQAPEWK